MSLLMRRDRPALWPGLFGRGLFDWPLNPPHAWRRPVDEVEEGTAKPSKILISQA